jgi:hypothetical protein
MAQCRPIAPYEVSRSAYSRGRSHLTPRFVDHFLTSRALSPHSGNDSGLPVLWSSHVVAFCRQRATTTKNLEGDDGDNIVEIILKLMALAGVGEWGGFSIPGSISPIRRRHTPFRDRPMKVTTGTIVYDFGSVCGWSLTKFNFRRPLISDGHKS